MTARLTTAALALLALPVVPAAAAGDEPDRSKYTRKQFEEDEKLCRDTFATITAKMLELKLVPDDWKWPPKLDFQDDKKLEKRKQHNAFAWFDNDPRTYKAGDTLYPRVDFTFWYMREVVNGSADACALILGHELGHLYLKHSHPAHRPPGKTDFMVLANSRSQEMDADCFGAELMLQAGFSLKRALSGENLVGSSLVRHTGFGALDSTHPGWLDRNARIASYAIMTKHPKYWRAMGAFGMGVALLNAENYAAAERCFTRVIDEFPECYEGLVNRGYARLMLYLDEMSPEDLKDYDVGQVMVGAFYLRVQSLVPPVRGKNQTLWQEAVNDLRAALKLKPDLALAKANLGLAYLFHYDGKQTDKATEFLQDAADALDADTTTDPLTRASTLVNLAAAQFADDNRKAGLKTLERAAVVAKKIEDNPTIGNAVLFNQALAQSGVSGESDRKQAVAQFEKYLSSADPQSAWWGRAYEKYADLCKNLKQEPKDARALRDAKGVKVRPPVALELGEGLRVTLGEKATEAVQRLGGGTETTIMPGMKRVHFEKHGLDILVVTDVVTAVVLNSPRSPAVKLVGRGPGGKEITELRVGMTQEEVRKMPGFHSSVSRELLVPETYYHYWRHLGIAVRYDDHPRGKIAELILVRIPEPREQP